MAKQTHTTPKYGMRPSEAAEAFGSVQLWNEAVGAGWLKPVVKRHKLTIYDAGDVARCWARIIAGELPNPKEAATA